MFTQSKSLHDSQFQNQTFFMCPGMSVCVCCVVVVWWCENVFRMFCVVVWGCTVVCELVSVVVVCTVCVRSSRTEVLSTRPLRALLTPSVSVSVCLWVLVLAFVWDARAERGHLDFFLSVPCGRGFGTCREMFGWDGGAAGRALLSVLLIDKVNLDPRAKKVTERDIVAAHTLQQFCACATNARILRST